MEAQKFLEELSVEQLINKYNFVVPEIQREYVWGNNDYKILDKFFTDIKEARNESVTSDEDKLQIEAFEKMLQKADNKDKASITSLMDTYLSKRDFNIGFLYSYRPDYYVYNDRNEDVYLIDGQQRFTTLFIALLYFSLKEGKYTEFKDLFRFDAKLEKIAFDYRVRTLTHNFIVELVSRCKTLEDLTGIEQKSWFLTDFAGDVTIAALNGTIRKLDEHFKNEPSEYFQFIKKQVRFWHFKTEETSQGEELYITMNSRGQQLAENETVRASLFENETVKNQQIDWGIKWEYWQDFFWRNRELEGNADNGLNQFLRWVNVMECFTKQTFKHKDEGEQRYKILLAENEVTEGLTLVNIEPYFDALAELKKLSDEDHFVSNHFKGNFNPIWLKGNVGQIHLLKLFPALMFLKENRPKEQLNRFIRFFSNMTNDTDIIKNPDTYNIESIQLTQLFLNAGFNDVADLTSFHSRFHKILSREEVCKLLLYKKETDPVKRAKLEEALWNAEDYKFSKGSIGHLLQLSVHTGSADSFTVNRGFNYLTVTDLNLKDFESIFSAYSELVNQEEEIWGELLATKVYVKQNDRLYAQGRWHLNDAFLKMVLERKDRTSESLTDFLIANERSFVLTYADDDALKSETDPQKQLYIYYILHKRILKNWSWSKWNVGIYDGNAYPGLNSIFNQKHIYQFYNQQWRYNVGYEKGTGIWLQDNFDPKRNYFQELREWAKK